MKIKDAAGQYLHHWCTDVWHNNITQGAPSTFLGFPVYEDDSINAGTQIKSGDYIGFLADLQNGYYIPENRNLETFVYNELFRQYDSIGFQVDINTGGLPVRPEAFVRLKAGGTIVGRSMASVSDDAQVVSLQQKVSELEVELAEEKQKQNVTKNDADNDAGNTDIKPKGNNSK